MAELSYVGEISERVAHGPTGFRSPTSLIADVMHVAIVLAVTMFAMPLMIAIALAVYANDGGPVLFRHRRVGRNGKTFYCLKFRTMAVDAEVRLADLLASDPVARAEWAADFKLRHDPRVTRIGAFLRRSSLDELPQLFNLMRGEMSLVGPRPIVEAEIARYGWRFRHYCAVKPGITGLWQVSGRNDVSYRSRVAMDCIYAKRKSPWLDLWVLAVTVPAVLAKRGSY
jgi:lipopolysaccharide/colanic/teichoic acid biosynthesis glycosyltransferase